MQESARRELVADYVLGRLLSLLLLFPLICCVCLAALCLGSWVCSSLVGRRVKHSTLIVDHAHAKGVGVTTVSTLCNLITKMHSTQKFYVIIIIIYCSTSIEEYNMIINIIILYRL
jgi:hypothetical protein